MAGSDFDGLLFLRGVEVIITPTAASGAAIAVGDIVKISGGYCLRTAAVADDLTLIGVAKEAHASTEGATKISVALAQSNAVYLANLAAADSLSPGDLLRLSSGALYTKLVKDTTDPVAMAVEKTSSKATAEVVLLAPATTGAIRLNRDAS